MVSFLCVQVENEDLVNVNIIAFRRLNQMDISGNVITPNEFLSHLKVSVGVCVEGEKG